MSTCMWDLVPMFKGTRSHLQPALNILKCGMNEEYTILITYKNSQVVGCRGAKLAEKSGDR